MHGYFIPPTGSTPSVNFRPKEGALDICGVSSPDDPLSFYGYIFSRLPELGHDNVRAIHVSIALRDIVDSSTCLHVLVKQLISLSTGQKPLHILWCYEKGNPDILALGQEISEYYQHPFKFVEVFKIRAQSLDSI